jgi:predicted DsbA family dithiol-disulfide isomerase
MDQAQPVGRIDVISDVICPWCYVGKRQLERALDLLEQQHLRFTVAWHPFQLNPDMPLEGVDRAQYRLAKFGSLERSQQLDERITETAATVGLEFHLDRLTRTPNTLNAHRLIRFAGQKGVQDGVVEALFEGYFGNGADIGDDTVLAKLGEEGGLDRDAGERRRPQGSRRRRPHGAQCRHPGRAELRAAGPCPVLRRRAGRGNGAGLPPRLGHPEEPRGLSPPPSYGGGARRAEGESRSRGLSHFRS